MTHLVIFLLRDRWWRGHCGNDVFRFNVLFHYYERYNNSIIETSDSDIFFPAHMCRRCGFQTRVGVRNTASTITHTWRLEDEEEKKTPFT